MRRSQSQRSMSRGTSRATFSPSESLMNGDYSVPPSYTPIYPQNTLRRSHTSTKTPLTRLNEHSTPSSLQKIMNFGLNPLKGLFGESKLKPVSENDGDLTRSTSLSDQSMNSSMSTNTGASIWRVDKHKSRGIPPRRLHDSEAMSGIVRPRSTSLTSIHHTFRSMQGDESRQSDTHENKRHRQSPRRSISRRLSNTSQRSSSLRNDVTRDVLQDSLLDG